jgi:CENP-B N-terminal DNA-binding domain
MKRKLTDKDVEEIRRRAPMELHKTLAKEFNVGRATISSIVAKKHRRFKTDNYNKKGSLLYD